MAASTAAAAVTSASAAPIASSTTFETSASTTVPPLGLTTPYAFPRECDTVRWNITIAEKPTTLGGAARFYETFLYIPRMNKGWWSSNRGYYETCFEPPSKTFAYAAEESRKGHDADAVYRGAVCPKDWLAFNVGLTSWGRPSYGQETLASTWSTAHCCKSGHTLENDMWYLSYERGYGTITASVCVQTITTHNDIMGAEDIVTNMPYSTHRRANETYFTWTGTFTGYPQTTYPDDQFTSLSTWTNTITKYHWSKDPFTSTIYWSGGRAFYPPWSAEWVVEDNATLDPPWPTLTSDMLIPTWAPGDQWYPEGKYDNKGAGRVVATTTATSQTKLGKVGVPLIATLAALLGVLILGGVLLWCLRRQRMRKGAVNERSSEDVELKTTT